MIGVKFGNKHSYDDFGLILTSKEMNPPEPETKMIEVPFRNGSIDLTESLTGEVGYKDRKISITFSVIDPISSWSSKISEIENFLHGKRMQIIFDDDAGFFYIGRLSVNKFTSNKSIGTLVIDAVVEPYKYDINSSADDWEWDSFDFETGIINQTADIVVQGTETVEIVGRLQKVCPTITTSAAMTVEFEGNTYSLRAGTNKKFEIRISEGINTLKFTGNGTVTIDYRGGSL